MTLNSDSATLVRLLVKHRAETGLSREHISRKTGISISSITRWEHGFSAPSLFLQNALRKYLKKQGVLC